MGRRPVSAMPATTAAPIANAAPEIAPETAPKSPRPPRLRHVGRTTLLLALSALLALSSVALAGTTGSGLLQRHEATHQALRHKLALRESIRDDAAAVAVVARDGNGSKRSNNSGGGQLPAVEESAASTTTITQTSSSPLTASATAACVPDGSKNPISQLWPNDISGNLNGTTMIIPITLAAARQAIPQQYGILEDAWRDWLPEFPAGMYPMMAVAVYDHDLRFPVLNITTPDFSRAALEFPFVDALNDGHSAFRWAANMLITAGSSAVGGSRDFGINVFPSAFDPPCNAYRRSEREPGLATFRAWASSDGGSEAVPSQKGSKCAGGVSGEAEPWKNAERSLYFETRPTLLDSEMPYPLRFLVNITNQPVFANTSICDNYKRLFNTTLTTDPANAPVAVRGTVVGNVEPFFHPRLTASVAATSSAGVEAGTPLQQTWGGVYGWRLSTAFLEPPVPVTCEKLKGYTGTGPGDSALP